MLLTNMPSLEKATAWTLPEWPFNTVTLSLPPCLDRVHNLTVKSQDPVAYKLYTIRFLYSILRNIILYLRNETKSHKNLIVLPPFLVVFDTERVVILILVMQFS